MSSRKSAIVVLVVSALLAAGVAGAWGQQPASQPWRLGLQMASDSMFGVIVQAGRFEVSAKAQASVFDGFVGNVKPDDVLVVGGHLSYLLGPWNSVCWGIGVEARQGIVLSGDTNYKQYIDGGLRLSCSAGLGERLMITGILCPFWISVRETDVVDSYSLTAAIPLGGVAAAVFF